MNRARKNQVLADMRIPVVSPAPASAEERRRNDARRLIARLSSGARDPSDVYLTERRLKEVGETRPEVRYMAAFFPLARPTVSSESCGHNHKRWGRAQKCAKRLQGREARLGTWAAVSVVRRVPL